MNVAFSAWELFLNFDALISKTKQHQRSNNVAVQIFVKTAM